MTNTEVTKSGQTGRYRSRTSLEAAARVAERASKRTGRPLSERAKQLLEQQRQR